jgi:hypothetical protein
MALLGRLSSFGSVLEIGLSPLCGKASAGRKPIRDGAGSRRPSKAGAPGGNLAGPALSLLPLLRSLGLGDRLRESLVGRVYGGDLGVYLLLGSES